MDQGRWLFRVASDPKWGGGHVSRCRVLARELVTQGFGASFWLDRDDGGWAPPLRADGFDVESETTVLAGAAWYGTVVDGYDLVDAATLNEMRAIARPLVCFVDHLPPQVDVDLTINAGADPAEGMPSGAMAGFECALVEPSFTTIAPADDSDVARLLVVMGRADTCGASLKVVHALSRVACSGLQPALTVVLGSSSRFLDDVRRALVDYPGPGELLVDVEDMVAQYARAHLVVVAGGVSLLECLAAGRASCVVQTAENQAGNVRQAVLLGGTIDAGSIAAWDESKFIGAVESLCSSASVRSGVATNARRAVDGRGAERVARAMSQIHDRFSLE